MEKDDPILQVALDRIQELVDERRKLEQFVELYRSLKSAAVPAVSIAEPVKVEPLPASPQPLVASTQVVVDSVMAILSANGAPMKLAQLFEELTARGVVVGGKIPRNNLGAKLSADPRLKTHKEFGWWFASDAYPDRRLEDGEYEEGLEPDEVSRPSRSNGAAVSPA